MNCIQSGQTIQAPQISEVLGFLDKRFGGLLPWATHKDSRLDYTASKTVMRRELLLLRKSVSDLAHREKSIEIAKRIVRSDPFQSAQSVHIYLAHESEVGTDFLIQEAFRLKKRVVTPVLKPMNKTLYFSALPRFDPNILEIGPFGIRQAQASVQERIPSSAIDLWLIPGVGFDLQGNRLGYGFGYYDRALKSVEAPVIGLAFDLQIVDRLPIESTDRPVSQIITETRTLHCQEVKRDRNSD